MQPSDEHQASFKQTAARPNLMSSTRRSGSEASILARLDSDPAARGGSAARLAWYGTAGLIAVGLTATLAWLAAGTGQPALELAQAGKVTEHKPRPVFPIEPRPPVAVSPQPLAQQGSAAVIVDAPPPAVPAPVPAPVPTQPGAPPLRMLEAAPAPAPPRTVAAPAKAAAPRVTTQARSRPPAAKAPPRQASRPVRSAGSARADTTVDSDVALISAVIFHANGHAAGQEGENATCADESCRPRPAR